MIKAYYSTYAKQHTIFKKKSSKNEAQGFLNYEVLIP